MVRLIGSVYEWMWRGSARLLGYEARPWTYIMREWSRQYPVQRHIAASLWYVALLAVGFYVEGWAVAVLVAVTAFSSMLWGHLYWDTSGSYLKDGSDFSASDDVEELEPGMCDAMFPGEEPALNNARCELEIDHAGPHVLRRVERES